MGRPLSEDVHGRVVRYLISMSIRTGCFVGIFFTEGWLRWVMAIGAILLPYVAVIFANAGQERPEQADTLIGTPEQGYREIEGPPGSGPPTFPPIDLRGGYLR